jgi:phosphoglycerate dehydrogenase-like enzyme
MLQKFMFVSVGTGKIGDAVIVLLKEEDADVVVLDDEEPELAVPVGVLRRWSTPELP